MYLTTSGEQRILDYVFGNNSFPTISNHYVGLTKGMPFSNGDNIPLIEFNGSGYARVTIPNDKNTYSISSDGSNLQNETGILFSGISGDWGFATHFFIATGETTGVNDLIFIGQLATGQFIESGSTASIASGAMIISIN